MEAGNLPVEDLCSPTDGVSSGREVKHADAFHALTSRMYAVLETYTNVHRGSGHHAAVTTHLYEAARGTVLKSLGLKVRTHEVIFCSPRIGHALAARFSAEDVTCVSSRDLGLALGVTALAVKKTALRSVLPVHTGGGAARLVSPKRVTWARSTDRFEAGTPAIVNIIAFAVALGMYKDRRPNADERSFFEDSGLLEILFREEFEGRRGEALLEALRASVIGAKNTVAVDSGERRFVHLDNAASTRTFFPVWDAARSALFASRADAAGVAAAAREVCARFLGAPSSEYDVVFTSNTTEAVNLAAESLGLEPRVDVEPVVLCSLLEHSSNDLPWRGTAGVTVVDFPVDDEGFVDLKTLESLLAAYNLKGLHGNKRVRVVAASGASNVLGTYNSLKEIGELAHLYGARLFVDGAQMVAHRTVDLAAWNADYFAFSAHKAYAPFGAGALVVRKGILAFNAAEKERIKNFGEENVVGLAALCKALVLLERVGMDVIQREEQSLTARALRAMARINGVEVFGIRDPGSPQFAYKGGVMVFNLGNRMPNRIADALAQQGGIGVRYGCHCAHMIIKYLLRIGPALQRFQHVLLALFPKLSLLGVVRVSFGIENTEADVDHFIETLGAVAERRPMSKSRAEFKKRLETDAAAASETMFAQL